MAAVSGVEFLNNKFDPFDVKLDGWGLDNIEKLKDELNFKEISGKNINDFHTLDKNKIFWTFDQENGI